MSNRNREKSLSFCNCSHIAGEKNGVDFYRYAYYILKILGEISSITNRNIVIKSDDTINKIYKCNYSIQIHLRIHDDKHFYLCSQKGVHM